MAKKVEKAAQKVDTSKAKHKATYATDKRQGGYIIRVAGPNADRFAGREVPVTMKNGEVHTEKLARLLWSGKDKESGENVSLYKFEAKPREEKTEVVEF